MSETLIDRAFIRRMARALEEHVGMQIPTRPMSELLDELDNTPSLLQEQFNRKIDMKSEITLQERGSSSYSILRVRRIINNSVKSHGELTITEKLKDFLSFRINESSTQPYVENLRVENGILRLMEMSKEPYSLLGRMTTYEDNSKEDLYVTTKPVLVIPNNPLPQAVNEWEDSLILREIEHFGFRRRVSEEKYARAMSG